jgi:hypothetical protein
VGEGDSLEPERQEERRSKRKRRRKINEPKRPEWMLRTRYESGTRKTRSLRRVGRSRLSAMGICGVAESEPGQLGARPDSFLVR